MSKKKKKPAASSARNKRRAAARNSSSSAKTPSKSQDPTTPTPTSAAPDAAPATPTTPKPEALPPVQPPAEPDLADIDPDTEVSDDVDTPQRAQPMLLEIGWEVCNKMGGIYTVLRTKVPSMMARWGQRYCLVGPYNHDSAQIEFEPATPEEMDTPIGQAVRQMREMGFGAEYGRWLVMGKPQVVLLHVNDVKRYLADIKFRLWADHQIPVPDGDPLIDDVVAFGEAVRLLMSNLAQREAPRRDLIAHFHEWMAGVAIPMLRKEHWPGSTVFTTHATLLGRYLAMSNPAFYEHLAFFDAHKEAEHFNIACQHGIERAAAHGSHVFTTVSDITGLECKHLLGRDPDVLLPNGLNIQRFAAIHEFQNLHQRFKQRIHEFTMSHFFPSYTFDLDNTLYFYTSGRYEYRNKGMDLTVESLARLNHRLRVAEVPVNVVFFCITKAPVKSLSVGELQSTAMLDDFRNIAEHMMEQLGDKIVTQAAHGQMPDLNKMVDEYWMLRLKRSIHTWKRDWLPSIVTHDLVDDQGDDVLNALRKCNLINHEGDKVKVVFHPDFITPTNPLWGMEYDEFVRGCNLGVFPSYYEPWGYTPLESIALGVPAITSDLSGFGSYLAQLLPGHEDEGLFCVHRRDHDFNQAADELADLMFRFCQQSSRERIAQRNDVESYSEHFDWHNLGRRYHEAHELALDRV